MRLSSELIHRVDYVTLKEFDKKHYKSKVPVIIKNALEMWPQLKKVNFDYLSQKIGDEHVRVQSAPQGYFHLDPEKGGNKYPSRVMKLNDYLDELLNNKKPNECHYMQATSIPDKFPVLLEEFSPPNCLGNKKVMAMNIWLGQNNTVTPLHYDPMSNFLIQLTGKKKLTLFHPNSFSHLYPYPWGSPILIMSRVNIDEPDYQSFPQLKNTEYFEVILNPGEMLYLPAAWWHQVKSLDTSISINLWWDLRLKDCLIPAWRLCLKTKIRNFFHKDIWKRSFYQRMFNN